MTNAIFALGAAHMDLGAGMVTDANGQVSVPTGAAGGTNAGAGVISALRAGLVPAAPKTAGFNTAVSAATSAIAAVSDAPTKAALTAVLAAVSALTAA